MNPQHAIVPGGGGALPANSQGIPWNAGYIVASGNLLTDSRSNAHAEGQGRLQTSRLYNMTDDPGVKETLSCNLARNTWHQQQWPLAIEQLQEDGYADIIEDSNFENENKVQADHTYWSFDADSLAAEGRWANGLTLVDDQEILYQGEPVANEDIGLLPAPDPKLFATYDRSQGRGKPAPAPPRMRRVWRTSSTRSRDSVTRRPALLVLLAVYVFVAACATSRSVSSPDSSW